MRLQAPGPVGVVAVQGSFRLHLRALERLGVEGHPVKKPSDLEGLAGLILPGGESTVISRSLAGLGTFEAIRDLGRSGLPLFGTCAGAILLGKGEGPPPKLELAPVELKRNAYGTQVDSFTAELALKPFAAPFHGIFIRAPQIVRIETAEEPAGSAGDGRLEVLGSHQGLPVLVRCGAALLSTFHPELTEDLRVHEYFLKTLVGAKVVAG